MIKISSRFDYALSCILRIADKYGNKKPVAIRAISRKERIESDYVEQLLIKMKRASLIRSVRGPVGGYILSRPPADITVKDIARAIHPRILELICFRKKGRRKKCIHLKDCKIRALWIKLEKDIEAFLRKHTLKELLLLRRKGKGW